MTPTSDGGSGAVDTTFDEALSPFTRRIMREVAHLLRSPLGSIVMLADTMQSSPSEELTDLQRRKLAIIHRAALAAAATMGDMLTLVGEEEEVARTTRFSVAEMVTAVSDIVRPVTESRGSDLTVRVETERPVQGPSSALSRALLGVALLCASRVRGGVVEISAHREDGDVVAFAVVATGAGSDLDEEPVEMLRAIRRDPESGEPSLSVDGLRLGGARALLRRLGSDVEVADGDWGLRVAFRLELQPAD